MSAGQYSQNLFRRRTERGRALRGIHDTQATAGPGPEIEKTAASAKRAHNKLHRLHDVGDFLFHCERNEFVLRIEESKDFLCGHPVEIQRRRVSLLGQQLCESIRKITGHMQ